MVICQSTTSFRLLYALHGGSPKLILWNNALINALAGRRLREARDDADLQAEPAGSLPCRSGGSHPGAI